MVVTKAKSSIVELNTHMFFYGKLFSTNSSRKSPKKNKVFRVNKCVSKSNLPRYLLYRYANADLKISLYVPVRIKTIPWKFCILNPKNLGLFGREFVNFLRSRPIFNTFYYFWMFENKLLIYLTCENLKK